LAADFLMGFWADWVIAIPGSALTVLACVLTNANGHHCFFLYASGFPKTAIALFGPML
jgi:hypothetical protein